MVWGGFQLRSFYRKTIGAKSGRPADVKSPLKVHVEMARFIEDFEGSLKDIEVLFNTDKMIRLRDNGLRKIVSILNDYRALLSYMLSDITDVVERNLAIGAKTWGIEQVKEWITRTRLDSKEIGECIEAIDLLLGALASLQNERAIPIRERREKVRECSVKLTELLGKHHEKFYLPFVSLQESIDLVKGFLYYTEIFIECFYVEPPRGKPWLITQEQLAQIRGDPDHRLSKALERLRTGSEWDKGSFKLPDLAPSVDVLKVFHAELGV